MKNERRKYEVILIFAVAILFLLCLVISVQAADMGEIHSGETKTGNIAYNGQTDSFTFYGNASQGVVISMSRESGGLNPCIYLYAPNGTLEVSASALYGPYPHYEHALLKDHLLEQSGL
ncbi:MAG: hypothetical protein KAT65_29990, partial [Methanophagales archaeon]|nr:hypothetical protein [Methanophagales archaeon]